MEPLVASRCSHSWRSKLSLTMRRDFYASVIERLKPEVLLLKTSRGLASRLRIAFYRMLGMKVGKRCRFEAIRARRLSQIEVGSFTALTEGCWLWPQDTPSEKSRIRIGSNNYFNRDVMIDACGYIEIGDHNLIGPGVYITDSNHMFEAGKTPQEQAMNIGTVVIGNGCWVGARAIILKDVHLGDDCVVAAASMVTKSFPSGSVIAGVPARLIDSRHSNRTRYGGVTG